MKKTKNIKVLFISSLFPNAEQPTRGMYNFYQLKYLSKLCDVKVVAPFFWFPMLRYGNKGALLENIPDFENQDNVEVYHPRVFYTPKVARNMYGYFYFVSLLKVVQKIRKTFDFNAIYTNWLYPDSFGARLIAKKFKRPYIAMGLGTDINEYLFCPVRGKKILDVINDSFKTFTVSKDLFNKVLSKGVPEEKLDVLYDGVDSNVFSPKDNQQVCDELGLDKNKKRILYIGSFEVWKGPYILIEAVDSLKEKYPDIELIMIGDGPGKNKLQKMIKEKYLDKKVFLKGVIPNNKLSYWINSSKVVCLPSMSEGVPNVMLESLSCGIPVVASNVGGIPEIIINDKLGILVEPNSIELLEKALEKAIDTKWDKNFIKKYSDQFSWERNAEKLYSAIRDAVESKKVRK